MEMFSTADVCRLVGIHDYQLAYMHAQRVVPEATRVGGRRVYSAADVEVIRQYSEAHGVAGRRRGESKKQFTP
jgi:DNA-binding transcriptional MerR regulator